MPRSGNHAAFRANVKHAGSSACVRSGLGAAPRLALHWISLRQACHILEICTDRSRAAHLQRSWKRAGAALGPEMTKMTMVAFLKPWVPGLLILLGAAGSGCSPNAAVIDSPADGRQAETALFAGGCYWTMEDKFNQVEGVTDVIAGTADVRMAVESQTPEHASVQQVEAVQVHYDPLKVSYRQLVDRYWLMVDPTDAGGQACDRGPSYTPMVLASGRQAVTAEASRSRASRHFPSGKFMIQIRPATEFSPVKQSEQDFAQKNAARYERYNRFCGRERKLRKVWRGLNTI